MSEHTPGPWKAAKVSGTWVIVDWEGHRQRRRSNETIGGAYKRTHGTEVEHEANAYLIAAAPDLLEACKSALNWALYNTADGREEGDARVAETLRQAIAKAQPGRVD